MFVLNTFGISLVPWNYNHTIAFILVSLLPLIGGLIVGASMRRLNTKGEKDLYCRLVKPWYAPPSWVYGPVWTLLYLLMGIAAVIVLYQAWYLQSCSVSPLNSQEWSYASSVHAHAYAHIAAYTSEYNKNIDHGAANVNVHTATSISSSAYTKAHKYANDLIHLALWFFTLQLAVNYRWSSVFFGQGNLVGASLKLYAFLIPLLAMTILLFSRINAVATFLMLPYLIWVAFASLLSYHIVALNTCISIKDDSCDDDCFSKRNWCIRWCYKLTRRFC